MGCDMHQKTMVWSKVQRKYVDCHEIEDYGNEWFPELFDGRYYDFFAVIGGVRGHRFQLYSETGMPEFMSKTFKKAYQEIGYHSVVSFTLPELEEKLVVLVKHLKGLKEKYERLKKKYPKKYYDHWGDDWDFDKCDDDPYDEYWMWDEDDIHLLATIEDVLKKLKVYHFDYPDDWMNNLIDPEKTVFVFYFDS